VKIAELSRRVPESFGDRVACVHLLVRKSVRVFEIFGAKRIRGIDFVASTNLRKPSNHCRNFLCYEQETHQGKRNDSEDNNRVVVACKIV